MKTYKVILKTLGKEFKGKGETMEEAFKGIKLSWEEVKSGGTLTATDGKKKYEHYFHTALKLRRIFSNKIIRAKWARNIMFLMKENCDKNTALKLKEK